MTPQAPVPIVRPVMPELDVIRGIAILSVFVYHAFYGLSSPTFAGHAFLALTHYGWAGVNLFFVLSGYLITGILLDSRSAPRYYARFYWRRALRILPAYYALLFILLLLPLVPFVRREISLPFLGLSFIYMANMAPLLAVPSSYGLLWSLAVEEHFYLLWPAVVKALSRRILAWVAAGAYLFVIVFRFYAVARGGLWWGAYTWLSADGLALGALLAVFVRSAQGTRTNLLRIAGLAAAIAAFAVMLARFVPAWADVAIKAAAVNLAAFVAVAMIVWLGTGSRPQLVRSRLLSFYGYISYGLYLVHLLVVSFYDDVAVLLVPRLAVTTLPLAFLRFPVVLVISTGIAYLSRHTFEEYFLSLRDRFPGRPKAAGGAAAGA